jgi:hypothetical protein
VEMWDDVTGSEFASCNVGETSDKATTSVRSR